MTRSHAFRLLVALVLTGYLLWASRPSDVLAVAAEAHWGWLALATFFVFLDRGVMVARWISLLEAGNRDRPVARARIVRIFLVSSFLGWFTPANVGGDLLRAWGLTREQITPAFAAASVVMDRLLGVLAMLLLAVLGLALGRTALPAGTLEVALGVTALTSAVGFAVVYSRRVEALLQSALGRLPERWGQIGSRFLLAVRSFSNHHGTVTLGLLLSLVVNLARVLQAWALGASVGLDAPLLIYLGFVPIAMIVMLMPINVGGLGPGQAVFVFLLVQAGLPSAEAFVITTIFAFMGVVGNLPGAVLYALDRRRHPVGP